MGLYFLWDLHLLWWGSVGFERPSVQNSAKMGITQEEIKNLLKEAIEPLERKLDNLNNVFQNCFFGNKFYLNSLEL